MKKVSGLLILMSSISVFASELDISLVKKFSRGKSVISNIHQLEKAGINDFMLDDQPWTSSYLPAIRGYAADPYATSSSNPLLFGRNQRKFMKTVGENPSDLSAKEIANLSTADKYDLLIGNYKNDSSLSYRLFEMADFIHDQFGKLTLWTGMCHGWAPASIAQPAPKKTVTLTSVDGKYQIPFYPNDIKSLITVAFANNTKAFVNDERIQSSINPDQWGDEGIMPIHGYACRQGRPKIDSDGRVVIKDNDAAAGMSNCEDVNPAFYHLAILNLLGRHQQGVVVDIDHNEKVNNHATAGYSIKYFNPADQNFYRGFSHNKVALSDFDDARAEYRSPKATHVVGVEITMKFVDYRFFKKKNAQDVDMQKIKERTFAYDLELDAQGNIVGGEWVNDFQTRRLGSRGRTRLVEKPGHKPDFIWYAPKGMKAPAYYENQVSGSWNSVNEPIPASWAKAAIAASYQTNLDYASEQDAYGNYPFRPQPEVIFSIAERMLEFSRQ